MRFEKVQNKYKYPSNVASNSLKRTSKLNSYLQQPTYKLIILLLSIICFSAFKDDDSLSNNQTINTLEQIAAIKNANERGVLFLVHLYQTSIKNPAKTKEFAEKVEELWVDTYPLKPAFLLLAKAEGDKSNGAFANTTNNTLIAIRIIEASEETPSKKKILCMAYLSYAKYTQFTKEKEGINFGYKALEIAKTINFSVGEVIAHDLIGTLIGYFNKDYQLALKHYQKAEKLFPKLTQNNLSLKYWVLANIAKAWSDLGAIEKSIDYKLKFLAGTHSTDNVLLLIAVYNNLGTNYFDLKNFTAAEKTLQKTIDLMKQNKVFYHLGIPLLRLGLIKLEQKKLVEATTYADAIDSWLIDHKFIGSYQVNFYQFKSKIAEANKNYEQAIHWIEKASIEQDSIDKIAGINNLIKLEESVKLKEIKQEQLLLEKELAINKAIINAQHIKLLAISFITILSIWFGLSFYQKNQELREAYNFILNKNNAVKSAKKRSGNSLNSSPSKEINPLLKEKILQSLETHKIFLSPDLTLKKFADQLSSNTSYLSQTINEGFGKNFNTLINEYRIKEVLQLFEEGLHLTFTIESIYKKAGFKSKSSFQKAFKNNTGVTASHYLEHLSQFSKKN